MKTFVGTAALAELLGAESAAAQGPLPPGANTSWARLITPNLGWDAHSRVDEQMAEFTSKIPGFKGDSKIQHVDPADLDQLCTYGFLFTNEMRAIRDQKHWANIREYLYRGGFLYVDHCFGVSVRDPSLDLKSFAQDHLAGFKRLLAGCEVTRLSAAHPIFQAPFRIEESQVPRDPFDPEGVNAIYGIFDDDRMIALLSMAHLLCNWDRELNKPPICSKMITNIHRFALNR